MAVCVVIVTPPLAAPVTTLRPRSPSSIQLRARVGASRPNDLLSNPNGNANDTKATPDTWLVAISDWVSLQIRPDGAHAMFAPDVDLVIAFRVSKSNKGSRTRREEGRKAEKQYQRLIETLTYAGLNAVGRRGESLGHLLVFVTCPDEVLHNLVVRER